MLVDPSRVLGIVRVSDSGMHLAGGDTQGKGGWMDGGPDLTPPPPHVRFEGAVTDFGPSFVGVA